MTQLPILTVTLNPALDLTTTVPRLEPQHKLRCGPAILHPGGGGANVSRAIRELGGSSRAFVALGGHTGHEYSDLLRSAGVDCINYALTGETRTSMTVMEEETGLHYRFVLPGPVQDPRQGEEILAELGRIIAGGVGYVVASGSLLPGIAEDFYARLGDVVRWNNAKLILDTHGAALQHGLAGRPFLIRLNQLEAEELATESPTRGDPAAVAAQLVAAGVADVAVFAMGERGSLVTTRDGQFSIAPPEVQVHSMVGAGDSYVAALTLALARGWSLESANRFGVAAAASAVTREATQLCERTSTERFYNETGKVTYISQAAAPAASGV
ncbi:MAG TPA: 1-phosphofructokinase family hexose kinase [Devosia sp.]|jgi:6-phosphofructokinase 2|uniref:1-phosphofructokinase family hexose kinase n=1 Tax=Devosia sp. TaxID=1871048 RepID=UPI002DDD126B|nr:1-phosphofructokinase family hexose kinase [Devosia sp.]HEV2516173.1 1-phosphofructokinase family hexose kinase [Devosia sp.]